MTTLFEGLGNVLEGYVRMAVASPVNANGVGKVEVTYVTAVSDLVAAMMEKGVCERRTLRESTSTSFQRQE